MNIYESDEFVMFFNLTTDPERCLFELYNFLCSYGELDVLYIISCKSNKLCFDDLILRQ